MTIDVLALKRLYEEEGESLYRLSRRFGIPHSTLYRRLKMAGCKMRNQSQAIAITFSRPGYREKLREAKRRQRAH